MMLKMTEINYDNFKNSVEEIERKTAYSNVWIELRKLQSSDVVRQDESQQFYYLFFGNPYILIFFREKQAFLVYLIF